MIRSDLKDTPDSIKSNLMEFGDLMRGLHTSLYPVHQYVMLLNGLGCLYYVLRYPRLSFNFKLPFLPASLYLAFMYSCLPIYYFLETPPMFQYCSEESHAYCKFGIHHLFTVVLFLIVYQFDMYSGPALVLQATHGIMNFASYTHHLTMYLFCQWYVASTVLCGFHVLYHCFMTRLPVRQKTLLWIILVVLAVVGINNAYSAELLSSCVRPEDSHNPLDEVLIWTFHTVVGLYCCVCFCLYTTEPENDSQPIDKSKHN